MAIKHVAVVLNSRAGALLGNPAARADLEAAFRSAGLRAEFFADDVPLPDRIVMAVESGSDAVVVAGGDGTIACAAHYLVDRQIPLGILPFGTMNLLAKDLHLPIGDVMAAVRGIAESTPRAIDVGDVNGHVFLCASMLGLPVRLGRFREEFRGSGVRNWLRMTRAGLRLLVRGAPVTGTVEVGGVTTELKAMTLTLTVNPVDEGSGLALSRNRLDTGQLGVYAVHPSGVLAYLRTTARLLMGMWGEDEAIEIQRVASITVHSLKSAMLVMNDGEISLIKPPLHYRIRPGALRVLAP